MSISFVPKIKFTFEAREVKLVRVREVFQLTDFE